MKSTTLFHTSRTRLCAGRSFFASLSLARCFATEPPLPPDLEARLKAELTSRPVNEIFEYLTNTNSHLLNITLADFLPPSCYPPGFSTSNLQTPRNKRTTLKDQGESSLPLGHHLVYFPPQVLNSDLLPDGTDILHSPGRPFVRRLWTGGSLSFNRNQFFGLHMINMSALCKEEITDVWTKGQEDDEKVFVAIRRRIGGFGKDYMPSQWFGKPEPEWGPLKGKSDQWGMKSQMGKLAVVETRNLVFLKKKSKRQARQDSQLLASTAMKRIKRTANSHHPKDVH